MFCFTPPHPSWRQRRGATDPGEELLGWFICFHAKENEPKEDAQGPCILTAVYADGAHRNMLMLNPAKVPFPSALRCSVQDEGD